MKITSFLAICGEHSCKAETKDYQVGNPKESRRNMLFKKTHLVSPRAPDTDRG